MKKIVAFPLDQENNVLIEVSTNESSRKLSAKKTIQKAKNSFDTVISSITPTAEAVISKMKNLVDSPDEISLEFGVKLNGELNAVIISSNLEANFKVNLKWKK